MSPKSLRLTVRIAQWCMAPILAGPLMAAPTGDPIPGHGFFHLTTDGQDLGYFTEASGIGSATEVVESKVIGPDGVEFLRKSPGRLKNSQLTLRKLLDGGSPALWAWRKMVEDGNVVDARATVTVTKIDEAGDAVAEWTFQNGWPSKVGSGAAANGGGMMAEITMVHEGCERVGGGAAPAPGAGRVKIEAGDVSMFFDSVVFSSESEIIEHQVVEGGTEIIRLLPGRLKYTDIILSRPLDANASLWGWRRLVEAGAVQTARRDVTIIAYEADGSERARWNCVNCWPTMVEGSMLPDSPAMETLHLAVEGMTLANGAPAILLPSSFNTPVGSTAQFEVTATDPNDDPVALTQLAAPAGSTFDRGTFTWPVPLGAVETTALVTFRADDQRSEPNSIVTRSLTITIPRDYDVDSMDDDWEVIWFGSIGNAPDGDKDGDGASNLNEFLAATSPIDSASFFKVNRITMTGSGAEISYTAEPGIQYQLEMNGTGLDRAGWSLVGTSWTETNTTSTLRTLADDTASVATAPVRFYRISARRP